MSKKKGQAEGHALVSHGGEPASADRLEAGLQEIESEARLRAVVDNAVDGIITIDEYGLVVDFNPAAQRLFGYEPEELVGQNIKMLMP